MEILFIADIVGKPGYDIVAKYIKDFKRKHHINLTIANGENSASGKGITPKIAYSFFDIGIDIITSGNHIWDKRQSVDLLEDDPRILRPMNYPPECPGHGSTIFETMENDRIGIINLQGRSFMYPIDCPFRSADTEVQRMNEQGISLILIDFHAEATAEKMALGWYLDGRINAVIGTHTHVQTADERILPHGTAYITDVGMTGPIYSVIGMDIETAIHRFRTQLPIYYKMADGESMFCGVIVSIDRDSGKTKSISRFQVLM
ncbi:TIGR00282 family metallophosphoesterase [bacterium]|nr:TIGR00282 family metallophosphoesterase [bacterium]